MTTHTSHLKYIANDWMVVDRLPLGLQHKIEAQMATVHEIQFRFASNIVVAIAVLQCAAFDEHIDWYELVGKFIDLIDSKKQAE
jgi:hypothetical protein